MKRESRSPLVQSMAIAARTKSNQIHIISRISGWVIKIEGYRRPSSSILNTQKEAVEQAINIAKSKNITKIVVHNKMGGIASLRSVRTNGERPAPIRKRQIKTRLMGN